MSMNMYHYFSTSQHRDFFMTFANGSDTATRKQILQRYEQIMGDQFTEEHKEKIYNLPIRYDGKVTYQDFLRNNLLERESKQELLAVTCVRRNKICTNVVSWIFVCIICVDWFRIAALCICELVPNDPTIKYVARNSYLMYI